MIEGEEREKNKEGQKDESKLLSHEGERWMNKGEKRDGKYRTRKKEREQNRNKYEVKEGIETG